MPQYSILRAAGLIGGMLVPFSVVAGVWVPTITTPSPCPSSVLGCGSGWSAGLATYVTTQVFPAVQTIFVAVAVFFFMYYGLRLMLENEDESTATEVKSAYGYGITGAAVVSLAGMIVSAVGRGNEATLINSAPLCTGIDNLVLYFRLAVGAAVAILVTIQGIRLIVLQGEESAMEQAKKSFFHGLLGVAVVILSNLIVRGFLPGIATGCVASDGSNGRNLADETVGVINFMLTILAALSVVAMIAAGVFLILSSDDSLKDRAKKTIFTTVVALIVASASYSLINYFVFLTS